MSKRKRISDSLQSDVLDLAIREMKAVLSGKKAMSDIGHSAFKVVGDYAKVVGAENQREMLDFTILKYDKGQGKSLTA